MQKRWFWSGTILVKRSGNRHRYSVLLFNCAAKTENVRKEKCRVLVRQQTLVKRSGLSTAFCRFMAPQKRKMSEKRNAECLYDSKHSLKGSATGIGTAFCRFMALQKRKMSEKWNTEPLYNLHAGRILSQKTENSTDIWKSECCRETHVPFLHIIAGTICRFFGRKQKIQKRRVTKDGRSRSAPIGTVNLSAHPNESRYLLCE